LRFDTDRRRANYLAALAVFVLALLTKSVTATLPAALLVVFWWQRGRLRWREDVVPLLPFFAVGLVSGLFTAFVERAYIGATGAEYQIPFAARGVIAGHALWFYLGKLLWPAPLMFWYPRWSPDVTPSLLLWPAAALLLLAALWMLRRRSRAPLAAMLFFAGTLFPALGFVNVYPFKYSFVADHFQYLASIGVITLAAAGLTRLAQRWVHTRDALAALALVIVAPLAILTFRQSRQYTDAETLYRATLAKNPDAWVAHVKLGALYFRERRLELAVAETRAALRLKPGLPELQKNLGTMLLSLGDSLQDRADVAGAIPMYQESLRLDPDNPETHHNLGSAFARLGRWTEAIAQFEETLRLNPSSERATRHLAQARAQSGIK
jgi:tetratricopeptide (TPR) repeat protein